MLNVFILLNYYNYHFQSFLFHDFVLAENQDCCFINNNDYETDFVQSLQIKITAERVHLNGENVGSTFHFALIWSRSGRVNHLRFLGQDTHFLHLF